MRFINHHQVVITPVDSVKAHTQGLTCRTGQVCVCKYIVPEAILSKNVRREIRIEISPVLRQLLRAQHKNILVAQLVILDYRQSSKRLAQTDTVRKDATVE